MGGKKPNRKKSASKPKQKDKEKEASTIKNSFPFLVDPATVGHVHGSRVMFIMRGLPGSGKSTLVGLLRGRYKRAAVCSADQFFMVDGRYQYDASRIQEAHETSHRAAEEACERGRRVVIIDNTHVRYWEMMFYLEVAERHDYAVVVVTPNTPWRLDPVILAQRNSHSVGEEHIGRMVDAFREVYPVYCGWFVDGERAQSLLNAADQYFQFCMEKIPQFRKALRATWNREQGRLTFDNSYTRPGRGTCMLHCTAFYRGRDKATESLGAEYMTRPAVEKAMGRVYFLLVIGLVITPRTVGARILLNQRQKQLWANDDNESPAPGSVSGGVDGGRTRPAVQTVSEASVSAHGTGARGKAMPGVRTHPAAQTVSDASVSAHGTGARGKAMPGVRTHPAAQTVPEASVSAHGTGARGKAMPGVRTHPAAQTVPEASVSTHGTGARGKARNGGGHPVNGIPPDGKAPNARRKDVGANEDPPKEAKQRSSRGATYPSVDVPRRGQAGRKVNQPAPTPPRHSDHHTAADKCAIRLGDLDLAAGAGSSARRRVRPPRDDGPGEAPSQQAAPKGPPRFQPTSGRGSRAHVTLGCAPDWRAVQTGLDLIDVIQCEAQASDACWFTAVPGAAARYYGQGRCVVYFDQPLRIPALFTGKY